MADMNVDVGVRSITHFQLLRCNCTAGIAHRESTGEALHPGAECPSPLVVTEFDSVPQYQAPASFVKRARRALRGKEK